MKFNEEKLSKLTTADEMLDERYGRAGTSTRKEFEGKAEAWYYVKLLKGTRKKKNKF